jgi:hypothetical protein
VLSRQSDRSEAFGNQSNYSFKDEKVGPYLGQQKSSLKNPSISIIESAKYQQVYEKKNLLKNRDQRISTQEDETLTFDLDANSFEAE